MARRGASRPACTRRGPDEKPSGPAPQGGCVASGTATHSEVLDGTTRGIGGGRVAVARAGHGCRVLGLDERGRRRGLCHRFEPDDSDDVGVVGRHLGPISDAAHRRPDPDHARARARACLERVTQLDPRQGQRDRDRRAHRGHGHRRAVGSGPPARRHGARLGARQLPHLPPRRAESPPHPGRHGARGRLQRLPAGRGRPARHRRVAQLRA